MTKQEKKIHEEGKITKQLRKNPWIVSTFVLGIFCLILTVGNFIPESTVNSGLDNFAKCLTDKEVKMYGTETCGFCKQQKSLFGDSFKFIDYIDCALNQTICVEDGIQSVPNWNINNQSYVGVQSLERLAALSGCELK